MPVLFLSLLIVVRLSNTFGPLASAGESERLKVLMTCVIAMLAFREMVE